MDARNPEQDFERFVETKRFKEKLLQDGNKGFQDRLFVAVSEQVEPPAFLGSEAIGSRYLAGQSAVEERVKKTLAQVPGITMFATPAHHQPVQPPAAAEEQDKTIDDEPKKTPRIQ